MSCFLSSLYKDVAGKLKNSVTNFSFASFSVKPASYPKHKRERERERVSNLHEREEGEVMDYFFVE